MGVIFRARQRHFRRIVVVKRVLVITGILTKTLARLPLRNANGRKPGSSQHPALGRILDIRSGEAEQPFQNRPVSRFSTPLFSHNLIGAARSLKRAGPSVGRQRAGSKPRR